MANKTPGGIDIFSSRSEIANLMDAATGEPPVAPPVVETIRTKATVEKESPAPLEVLDDGSTAETKSNVSSPRKSQRESTVKPKNAAAITDANVQFRFRVPSELKGEWSTFKAELSAALGGTALDDSNIGRPLLEVLLVDYKEQILAQAQEIKGTLKRPSNSDRMAMAEMDEDIGQLLRRALRQRRKKN